MRHKLAVLAVAALLALSTGGVVGATLDTPTDESTETELPNDHTVENVNPDELSEEEADRALEAAWANETVRSYFDDDTGVHFKLWASAFDEDSVSVHVAPVDAPDDTRVIAEVDLTDGVVTRTHEPVRLNASNAIEIDGSNYDIETADAQKRADSDANATRISSDELQQVQLNESSIERGGDGTFTIEIEGDEEVSGSEEITRIDTAPEN